MTTKNWQDYTALAAALDLANDDVLVRDKSNTTDHATEGTVLRGSLAAVLGSLNHICQGRLTLSTSNPIYNPQAATPSATDTTAETVDFAAAHGWTKGTMVTPSATGGGLTAGTIYYVSIVDADTVAFHTTVGNLLAGTKVNLTASITAVLTPFGVQTNEVFFTPYNGNLLSLYDGTRWKLYSLPELTLTISGFTSGRPHDVFVYDNAGTLTLEALAWTSDTARATALVLQDGIYVKSGATTRRYLGTLRSIGTNTCEDSWSTPAGTTPKRFLWNHYNRIPLQARAIEDVDSWTYNSPTWRSANNDATNRIEFVVGLPDAFVNVRLSAQVFMTNIHASTGIGLDVTNAPSGEWMEGFFTTSSGVVACSAFWSGMPKAGYHFLQWIEKVETASASATFYGDNNNVVQNGLRAEIMG